MADSSNHANNAIANYTRISHANNVISRCNHREISKGFSRRPLYYYHMDRSLQNENGE